MQENISSINKIHITLKNKHSNVKYKSEESGYGEFRKQGECNQSWKDTQEASTALAVFTNTSLYVGNILH